MALKHLLRATILTATIACPTAGQVSSRHGPPRSAEGPLAAELIADMTRDLRNLATAMEDYFSRYARYGRQLGPVGDTTRVQTDPSPGVTLTLVYFTRNSWTARATHDWLPGRSCVMYVGTIPPSRAIRTTRQRLAPSAEAEAACDAP